MTSHEHTSDVSQTLDKTERYPYSFKEYLRRTLWECVQATIIRFSPRRAYGWRRWWLRRFGASVAKTSGIRPRTRITFPWLLTMGERTILSDDVHIYNLGPVTLGCDTVISQGAYLCAGSHDYTRANLPLLRPPITIGDGVWICAQAFIGPGVTVGDRAVVAARAVVVKDVPPDAVVAGNPAKTVKQREMREG